MRFSVEYGMDGKTRWIVIEPDANEFQDPEPRLSLSCEEGIALRDWLNAEFPATVDNGTPGNSPEGVKMEALQ